MLLDVGILTTRPNAHMVSEKIEENLVARKVIGELCLPLVFILGGEYLSWSANRVILKVGSDGGEVVEGRA